MTSSKLYAVGGIQGVLIGAALLIILGVVITKLLGKWIKKFFSAEDNRRFSGSIFVNLMRFVVWGAIIAVICDECFGIDAAGIIGALGVVGIAVSLGAQQTIANVIGGLIISISKTLAPGDWVTIGGHTESVVVDTDWRSTTLRDENGITYIVPNSEMVSSIVAKGNPFYTIVIPFAVSCDVHDIDGLLVDCEQVLLDRQIEKGHDFEQMRPKASVMGTEIDGISCEVKIYVDRTYDTRYVLRDVSGALIELLQDRGVMARMMEKE